MSASMRDHLWRHKKRGTTYRVLFEHAGMQCAAAQEFEDMFADDYWVVYQNVATAAVYVRPYDEFMDGRFEIVAESASAQSKGE